MLSCSERPERLEYTLSALGSSHVCYTEVCKSVIFSSGKLLKHRGLLVSFSVQSVVENISVLSSVCF